MVMPHLDWVCLVVSTSTASTSLFSVPRTWTTNVPVISHPAPALRAAPQGSIAFGGEETAHPRRTESEPVWRGGAGAGQGGGAPPPRHGLPTCYFSAWYFPLTSSLFLRMTTLRVRVTSGEYSPAPLSPQTSRMPMSGGSGYLT